MLIGKYGAITIIMPKEINGNIESSFALNEKSFLHVFGVRNFCKKYKDFKVNKNVYEDPLSFNYVLELVRQGCLVIEISIGEDDYLSFVYVPKDVMSITQEQICWLNKHKFDLINLFKEKYCLIKVDSFGNYDGVDTYNFSVERRIELIKDYFKASYKYTDRDDLMLSKGEDNNVRKKV